MKKIILVKTVSVLSILVLVCLGRYSFAFAEDKVVIIPLGGKTRSIGISNWNGTWESGQTYQSGATIQHDGSTYLCLTTHNSDNDNAPPNSTYWNIIAAKGEPGPTGPPGPQGLQGPPGVTPNKRCPGDGPMIGIDSEGDIICAYKTVFLSSIPYDGAFGGLAGADIECNTLASNAGLPGEYKAWMGDSTDTPHTRFKKSIYLPYVMTNGVAIAKNWDDLIDGEILTPLNVDEYGQSLDPRGVWTGTYGINVSQVHCNDWTSNSATVKALRGANYSVTLWTGGWQRECDSGYTHIYCFEQ